jgi:DNA-3-methyladenine glycosylase II
MSGFHDIHGATAAHMNLTPAAPFDFTHSLRFLGLFTPSLDEQSIADVSLKKAVNVGRKTVVFEVNLDARSERPRLKLTVVYHGPGILSTDEAEEAADHVRFYLSLDDHLGLFYAIAQDDPYFAPIVKKLYGYHQVKFGMTGFEAACWAIIAQRNTMTLNVRMRDALVKTYGRHVMLDGVTYSTFPTAERLAAVDEYDLATLIRHGPKAEALGVVARAFRNVDEHWLRAASFAEVERWLRSIKGIGEWSASFILVRGLGRMESNPLTEKRLVKAIHDIYGPGQDLSRAGLERLAARYGPWQGYWAHYMRVATD